MNVRDINWHQAQFGLHKGYVGKYVVATVEATPHLEKPYRAHVSLIPIIPQESHTRIPADTLEEAKLVASQRVVHFINQFLQEVEHHAA